MAGERILVIDDEPAVRFGIRDFLEQRGYQVEEAEDCRRAREVFPASGADAAVVDYVLPDGNALELLAEFKEGDPGVPAVILTGHGTIDLAVRAIQEGADHFLTKPVELPTLLVILERLLEGRRDRRQRLALQSHEAREDLEPFLGASAAIRQLAEQARKVAAADCPVLIRGETGSGKGVLARWLHAQGPRAEEAFVDVNCAGLSRELLETELFGHEKGAFTSAARTKTGLLEVAHRGTVFLDEIGDLDPQVQPKLLKVLEEKQFRRLGGVRDHRVDIRLIAATHQDLAQLARERKFRSDLYFRISALVLTILPLRQRAEDVPLLARRVLQGLGAELSRGDLCLSPEAEQALRQHSWPGNIRELRNVLERAVLLGQRKVIRPQDLSFDPVSLADAPATDANLTLQELERRHIERVLREEGGHVGQAAARLGIPRSSLYQKLKRYGIATSRP